MAREGERMELDAKKICGVVAATAHAEREVVKSRRGRKETAFPSPKASNILIPI